MLDVKEAKKTEPPQRQAKGANMEARSSRMPGKPAHVDSVLASRMTNPVAFFRRIAEEMDRIAEDFGIGHFLLAPRFVVRESELLKGRENSTADWFPQLEVRESNGNLQVEADLPGLSKGDISVELTDDTLMIRGERKQEAKEEREGYAYCERHYGSFSRAIPLPEGADTSKATAEFRSGVLVVTMPVQRPKQEATRRVEVIEKS
jgi:HSP20 family protein